MKGFFRPLLLALALVAPLAHGGQACGDRPLSVEEMRQSFSLAFKVRQALEESGAQVALLARVGQDLSSYGLRYSHGGILWRDHPEGPWLAVHELNECGTAVSGLYNQGLANFFADNLFAWDALILIPSPATQQRLAEKLADGRAASFHHAGYNMVAYPFATRYQNSNQWLLEVLAEALADQPFSSRAEAQQWLQANGYQPTTLALSPLKRLGGRMFRANVAFDDHPLERRVNGQIDTVTVESVAAFLARRDSGSRQILVRLP